MDEFFNGISQLESFKSAIQSFSDVLILLIIIIIAVIVLAPTIVSIIRRTRLRKIIVITNIIAGFFFLVNVTLPFIIWAVLFIVALIGKKELKTTIDMPPIIINTSSSQVNNKESNRR